MTHIIGYPGYDILIKNIETAENSYLYDTNGRKYVDLESGVWCMSIGLEDIKGFLEAFDALLSEQE